MYLGVASFVVCTHCTRMYNGQRCPECGNSAVRIFSETTAEERKRWEAKMHFADPAREKVRMDPDANLEEQRRLSARLVEAVENARPVREADVQRLAELVITLDGWISGGGFLPRAWKGST